MSNLLASLHASAGTLEAYGRVLETAQNNVSNASTAGYAKQRLSLEALAFDPASGASGGVRAGRLETSRNEYAETAVRDQAGAAGYQDQMVNGLSEIEARLDISGNSGIPLALNHLFESFSSWATTPGSTAVRQAVIQRATQLADAFQQSYKVLAGKATTADQEIRHAVDQINQKVSEIQNYNHIALQGNKDDGGLSAHMHAALEELSQYINFDASFQSDGSVSITVNGQTPLLLGDKQYLLSAGLGQNAAATYPSSPADAVIRGSDGADITAETTGGQLGALLTLRNQTLSSLIGNGNQPGELNVLAKQIATRVNELLTDGQISAGDNPVAGVPLFTFDAGNDAAVAQTLAVDSTVTPDQLAGIDPGPPAVSNGVPLALAQLADPVAAADQIDGLSYSQYYGQMAGRVGSDLAEARNNQQVQQSILTQSKALRDQFSGVNLNEEAAILIQFQRAYQATSRFITILDDLTETAINIIRQ